MDFRQSQTFAKYLEASGWLVERLSDGKYLYIFKLPLLGSIIRSSRTKPPINFKEIDEIAKKHDAILIKIEPDAQSTDSHLAQELKKNGYVFDNWSIEPTQTQVVNLTLPSDKLFTDIRPKWRQYIRLAQKKGVKISRADKIEVFNKIWQQNAQIKGYLIENPEKTKVLWNELKKAGAAELLFAFVNREPVAAVFLIYWGKKGHLWHMAYNGKYEKFHPVRLLIWESILRVKGGGLKEFDFEGIEDPRLPYTKNLQPTFFKKGFGGFERQYLGSFVKYINPFYAIPFILVGKFRPQLFRMIFKKFYG